MEFSGPTTAAGGRVPRQQVACVGMKLGRYELTRELGEGGMATVFEARDTQLNRLVAVKVMFPHLARRKEAASRFKREARAAAGLDHDHILRVFDVGGGEVVDGALVPPYIVLELIDGASLADIYQERAVPLAEVVAAIGVAICRALAVAHEANIVHRDIKPANIMVTTKGRLVLADFGVARVEDDDSVVTRTGSILGTPAYMSPEQACSDPVDGRSDLYSLGASLHRLATGSLPYTGSTAQVVAAMLDGNRRSVEQLAPAMGRELSRVIDKLMERHATERYQTPAEAEAALLEVVAGGGFADPDALLVEYFCDPEGSLQSLREKVIAASLRRANMMANSKRVPLALSLAERVLHLAPANLQARAMVDTLGRRQGQRVWVAIVGPMVVTAAVGTFFWLSRPERPVATYADAGLSDAGIVDAPVSVDGATVVESGALAHDAAIADAAPSVKGHKVDRLPPIKKIDASVLAIQVDAAPLVVPELVTPPVKPAQLIVAIGPWCDVHIDGKATGKRASKTEIFELSPGKHSIFCVQPTTQLSWAQEVVLVAGEQKILRGSVLPPIKVTLALSRGARAKIGKELVANGKEIRLPGERYLVEVTGADGETIDSRYLVLRESCTLKDQPRIACFAD